MVEMPNPGEGIGLELVRLRRQIDRLELRFSQLAAAFERSEYWSEVGDNSGIDWIRFNCHMTRPAAAHRLAVGERLSVLPDSSKAMEAGEIGFAHLTILARTADAVGKDFDETKLLELAKEHSPGKFYFKCEHYRHSVNAKAYAAEQAEQVENRRLSLCTAEDG